ncbi:MAG: hypothetical protein MUF22_09215, partial [Chitinispirillaceae bacterium]|nr:hypothetical protein [Chitinispirillaceae bacterium]
MRIQHTTTHLPASPKPEFFTALSGQVSARVMRPNGPFHFHSAIKPENEADYFNDYKFWGDLIVFLGIGMGYHVKPFLKNIPAGAKILLVDYYP